MSTPSAKRTSTSSGVSENLQARVYRALKHDITHFEFMPRERLSEAGLSDRYGVSRTPVREALAQLEREGLVATRRKGGRYVRDIDVREYEDVSRVRLALELLAVSQACERALIEDIDRLAAEWDADYRDPVPEDGSFVSADERFHLGIAQLSENELLINSLGRVNDRIRIVRMVDFTSSARIGVVRRDHAAILSALRRRDEAATQRLLKEHIEVSQENIRNHIGPALERIFLSSRSVSDEDTPRPGQALEVDESSRGHESTKKEVTS